MRIEHIGDATLYLGDCMDIMREMLDKAYSLAIVDPPYGIGVDKMTLGNGAVKIYRGTENWDILPPSKEYFFELFRVSKNQIIWGANNFSLPPMSSWIFWDKLTGANDFSDGELAWSSFGGALRKYTKLWLGANAKDEDGRIHPTQKPVALYKWLLSRYAKPGDTILDTHGGSGSSVVACMDMGYSITWIEKDEDYFNAALKRIEIAYQQPRLFDEPRVKTVPQELGL